MSGTDADADIVLMVTWVLGPSNSGSVTDLSRVSSGAGAISDMVGRVSGTSGEASEATDCERDGVGDIAETCKFELEACGWILEMVGCRVEAFNELSEIIL